jgi:hypothetical protein
MVAARRPALGSGADPGQGGAMTTWRRLPPGVRRALAGWLAVQALVAAGGRLMAWWKNEGDESSTSIRRVLTHYGLELRPTNPALARVRMDLAMAGAEVDLTGVQRPKGGIDLTARLLMGGLQVRVPADWRVWWEFHGIGGIDTDGGIQRTHDEHAADLRVHAGVVFGGIGIGGPQS